MDKLNLQNLSKDQVLSVYSGRDGKCCCGCSGKHSYNPAYEAEGSASVGYPVFCDGREVSRILNLVKKFEDSAEFADNNEWVSVTVGKKLYIVYPRRAS